MKKKPAIKKKAANVKAAPSKKRSTAASIKPKASPKPKSLMLVYGFGDNHEPRAAMFSEEDFKLAKKAAGRLGLQVFVENAEKLQPALKGIKTGDVYASGSGFAPEIGHDRFNALLAGLGLSSPPLPSTAPKRPTSWDEISVGNLIMAQADSPTDGWWPGVVEKIEDQMLVIRSTDFPEITVTRHRCAIALGYSPDYVAPDDAAEAAPGLPTGWNSLKPDHLVIARQGRSEGSFEALVTKIGAGRVTLRWRDFPKLPAFTRTFTELALLYPRAPEPAAEDETVA